MHEAHSLAPLARSKRRINERLCGDLGLHYTAKATRRSVFTNLPGPFPWASNPSTVDDPGPYTPYMVLAFSLEIASTLSTSHPSPERFATNSAVHGTIPECEIGSF